ncbi:winged helix-turn-helix domain-containing protein [Nonomuraea sp. NPDC003804]|uniref:ArsR/SmtB family transcription factor n=1 Tax=Nonomuraea sp. NPDC003804 TaxID=3154547 RepID=UPI0033BA71DC
MIQLRLSAAALEATRFAVSPLMETAIALQYRWFAPRISWQEPAWARMARAPRTWQRFPLLSLLWGHRDPADLPLDPVQDGVAVPAITQELKVLLEGLSWSASSGSKVARAARDLMTSEDHPLRRRLVDETERFYRLCLAPHWPDIEDWVRADIRRRTATLADEGLGRGLRSLHPTVTYRDQRLRIEHEDELDIAWDQPIVLVPSTLAHRCFLEFHAPENGGLRLVYPALRPDALGNPEPLHRAEQSLGEVLGHTRLMLLRSLVRPRTTTQLAATHHLSPSTVSYHLTRLFKAGLLERFRDGHAVRYQLSLRANQLFYEDHLLMSRTDSWRPGDSTTSGGPDDEGSDAR